MLILASIDWVAVGAIATGCAMVATAIAAVFTARMAVATKTMAEASQSQLEFLRRQATAAETAVEQAERTIDAEHTPVFRVQRTEGRQAVAVLDNTGFFIQLSNEGPVKATIDEATITVSMQPVALDPVPANAIEPGQGVLVRCNQSPLLSRAVDRPQPVPVQLVYHGPNGKKISTRFSLKRKSPGAPDERWLVDSEEADKPYSARTGIASFS